MGFPVSGCAPISRGKERSLSATSWFTSSSEMSFGIDARFSPRSTLVEFSAGKKRRAARCPEYARCMKWAGTSWRQSGGCRRGCKNDDEDPENLPSWHRSSRWFDEEGDGTHMVGGGRREELEAIRDR